MKKFALRFLAIFFCVLLTAFPALSIDNPVDDLAGVFSSEFVSDLSRYAQLMQEELGIPFSVVTRHFLGGKNIQSYANQTLESLPESQEAILLVLVIGEESYAVAIGEESRQLFSPEKAEALLNDHFRASYLNDRAYEKAVASFVMQAGNYLGGRLGVRINAAVPLTRYTKNVADELVLPTIQPDNSENFFGSIFENASKSREDARRYDEDARHAENESEKDLSLFQIALIGFVLYKIFGRGNRKKNKNQRKGCGPLGWIFGAWGISKFFGWRK